MDTIIFDPIEVVYGGLDFQGFHPQIKNGILTISAGVIGLSSNPLTRDSGGWTFDACVIALEEDDIGIDLVIHNGRPMYHVLKENQRTDIEPIFALATRKGDRWYFYTPVRYKDYERDAKRAEAKTNGRTNIT